MKTSVHMEWTGVRVDATRRQRLPEFCREKAAPLEAELLSMGIDNPNSPTQLRKYFGQKGLLDKFKIRGKYSFDKKQLERCEGVDPAIPLLLTVRKFHSPGYFRGPPPCNRCS